MTFFPCPYLESDVKLTDEREHHITLRHSNLLPKYRQCIRDTLMLPDEVRRSSRIEMLGCSVVGLSGYVEASTSWLLWSVILSQRSVIRLALLI